MFIRILKNGIHTFCIIIVTLSIFTVSSFTSTFADQVDWDEYKSDHFVISYHPSIPHSYIREFSWECERYYNLITERLGFNRFNFWLWENRAKIFLHKTRKEYLESTSQPGWSAASVHIPKKIINTFHFQKDFFDNILPHELTHIVLREFIGLNTQAPLWFEEGAACANEKDSSRRYLSLAKELVESESYAPVAEMEKANERQVRFPTVFYPTAASLVIFLLEDYSKRHFVQLCRELRDGNDFYRTMDKVYGIKDAEDLNEKFLGFLASQSYKDTEDIKGFGLNW